MIVSKRITTNGAEYIDVQDINTGNLFCFAPSELDALLLVSAAGTIPCIDYRNEDEEDS